MTQVSNCCGAKMLILNDGITFFYRCDKCLMPCTPKLNEPKPQEKEKYQLFKTKYRLLYPLGGNKTVHEFYREPLGGVIDNYEEAKRLYDEFISTNNDFSRIEMQVIL